MPRRRPWRLNGGTIQDASGIAAILTLPAPGVAPDALGPANILIDTTAPSVAVNSLVTTNNEPKLTGTTTDPAPSSGLTSGGTFSLAVLNGSGQTAQTLTATYTNVVTNGDGSVTGTWSAPVSTALADGAFTFQATAADIAGNSATPAASGTLTVDTAAPSATVNALSTGSAKPTLTGTVTDPSPSSGVAGVTVTISGGSLTTPLTFTATVNGTIWSVTVTTALSVGTYSVTATATDKAGNVGTASPSAALTITAANSSISGFVYIDPTGKGQREISSGVFHAGLGDVTLTLSQSGETSFTTITAVTGADGSYDFGGLAAGTYIITETNPAQYIDGQETAGTQFGGTPGTGTISGIVVVAGESGTEYDFSETGLKLPFISKRLSLASTPSTASGLLQQSIDAAPVVQLDGSSGTNFSAVFTSGGAVAVVNGSAARVTHADGGLLTSLTATITNLEDGADESLSVNLLGTNPAITSHYADGVLELSGLATAADYQAILRTVTFNDTSATPNTTTRTITFVANEPLHESNIATTTLTVAAATTPQADLSIAASDDSEGSVNPGQTDTYTIVVTNNGPSSVTGATVFDPFASTVASDTFTATSTGSPSGFLASGTGNINDTVTMPTGSKITYTVLATVGSSVTGTLTNTATVTAPPGVTDPNLNNNSATVTDTIVAPTTAGVQSPNIAVARGAQKFASTADLPTSTPSSIQTALVDTALETETNWLGA